MNLPINNIHLASNYSFRYVVFLILLVIGPSFALMQLKGFHFSVVFLSLMGFLYLLRARHLDIQQAKILLTYGVFVGLWLVMHTISGAINLRYVTYLFYFTFTFAIFYFSFRTLVTLSKETIFNIIQIFIYIIEFIDNFIFKKN